jgi:hypothetical protein
MRVPETAAWRLVDAHEGFEVLFPRGDHDGYRFDGHSVGVKDGKLWSTRYTLELDAGWTAHWRTSSGARGPAHATSGSKETGAEPGGSGANPCRSSTAAWTSTSRDLRSPTPCRSIGSGSGLA